VSNDYSLEIGALLVLATAAALACLLRWVARREARTMHADHRATAPAGEVESLVASRTRELSALAAHLLQGSEDEKAGVARRLHGELGSTLIAAKMDIESVAERLSSAQPELAARLARAQGALEQAVAIKRELIDALRPSLLDNLGFAPAVQWEVSNVAQRAQLAASVDIAEETAGLPQPAAMSLFRIVQAALANVVQHAQAKNVSVEVSVADSNLSMLVEDDGIGIADSALRSHLSHGLAGIRQRTRVLGGECSIRRGAQGGTLIEINVPFAEAAVAAP
jgi:signal transduction histidine kinase